MSNLPLLRTKGLSYAYSTGVQTVCDIDLSIEKGTIYGFLGPNGSGKTTTLRLLLGILKKQKGEIQIFGQCLEENRIGILKRVGSLIETPSLYGHLTAKENLEIYRRTYGVSKERITDVLAIVGLEDTGRKLTRQFSLGMKQRLAIALALLPAPDLLILDEPTNGLDPAGIIELRALVKKLNTENGMTILVSSHLLSEVEKMASHIGILSKGKMLFQGPLSDLQGFQQKGSTLLIDTSNNEAAIQLLQDHCPEREGGILSIPLPDQRGIAAIQRTLTLNNLDVYLLQPQVKNDLEQLFIDLVTTHA